MTVLAKTLLTIAIGGLTFGSLVACYGENASPVALAAVLPLGAVTFGMFLIVFILEKEVASYDREQATKEPAPKSNSAPAPAQGEICSQPIIIQPEIK